MKMKGLFCLAAGVAAWAVCAERVVLSPLPGERWWGGATIFGLSQPYGDFGEKDQNLHNYNNQTAPLFVSSAGRYVWSDAPVKWSATGGVLTVEGAAPVKVVKAGETLKAAFCAAARAHFPSTGTLPDEMFFTRPQYNHAIEAHYTGMNQESVETYACGIAGHGFPMGIIMVDDGWEKDFGVWEFNPATFPRPKAMVEKLHALGAKVMLWLVPYVSGDSLEALELTKRRLVLERPGLDGAYNAAAIVKWWSGYSLAYDLSLPEARDYLRRKLRGLQADYGIDGYKFDGADLWHYTVAAPTPFAFRRKGYTAADNCREWSLLAAEFPFNEMRASYNTAGQPLVQRLQDKAHSWEALRQLVPDMLAAGILGYAYTCADMIGGGLMGSFVEDGFKFDSRLFVRSCQTHALLPMMQFSIAPWRVLSPEETACCRAAAELHVAFAPYILSLARHAARTGEPIVRLMEYEFPHQGLAECRDQFMLGPEWLVAPVTEADGSRTVRLPAGRWRDDLGEVHDGPKTLALKDVPLGRLPRFRRLPQ